MELFKHQKEGISFLKDKKKAILADEMGLGKTRQAILAAEGKTLVVCPASLKINWQREIRQVFPDATVQIIDSKNDIYLNSDWDIINYDILEKRSENLKTINERKSYGTLILDEAHYIKGKSIRASVIVGGKVKKKDGSILSGVGLAGMIERVYALTGTPLLNRPVEMFNLLTAIGHPLGGRGRRSHFVRTFCGGFTRMIFGRGGRPIWIVDESGSSNLGELRKQLAGWMLRRKKEDVLDLPEKMVSVMPTEMSKEYRTEYKDAWNRYLLFLEEIRADEDRMTNAILARHLIEIGKLKQVCSLSKTDRIVGDIRGAVESGEKVIVFSQYTKTIQRIAEELRAGKSGRDAAPKIGTVTLTGQDDQDARQKAVDAFQNDENTKVFVANIKAGGVGITLTKASIVMFADMEWSPELHRQAEDRAHRIGQTGTVNVYYYIAQNTIDEKIVDILNRKKNVADQVIDGDSDRIKGSNSAFLEVVASLDSIL